ncbi:MAG TPA: sugar ABC transporter ATP-binding protein [Solirubrobacteraceae bacterium]|nr:sugar ABC transporter ATP-binding protein [Solirubrobacteraceae bacterium]
MSAVTDKPFDPQPLLRVSGLSKTFPGLKALDDVSFTVGAGEIVAVVGHNGSGKSTLVKILAGVYQPDPGATIEVRDASGQPLTDDAARQGLHFIHQELGLINMLSTVENMGLGRSVRGRGLRPIRTADERDAARRLIARFGTDFDPTVPVAALSPAERAIVAIVRAMDGWTGSENVLVLDEPTAAFHGDEVEVLFEAVRRIAAAGAGVVFISHRLDEVLDLADRVVALRDGRVVADQSAASLNHDQMVQLIAGRTVADLDVERESGLERRVLRVEGVKGQKIQDVSFELGAGEIVGVSGILGSGREELAGLLFGMSHRAHGFVEVTGEELISDDPVAAIDAGMGFVPADRRRGGAVMEMNVRENLTLPLLRPLRRAMGRLDERAERSETREWMATVGLRPPNPNQRLKLFSGGNQQKVVLAKWLRTRPRVLLLDEPTQGVDVGAKAAIYELILAAARSGTGVLVCSSDTKELVALCDRVLVLDKGRIISDIGRRDLNESRLVRAELGLGTDSPADLVTTAEIHDDA